MTQIGILTLPEAGHVDATIQLGRELRAAGHAVRYLGDPRDRALFEQRDLPFTELPRIDTAFGPSYDWTGWRDQLVLIDLVLFRAVVDACVHGARVIQLSTTFPLAFDPDVPPIDSDLLPGATAAIADAWRAVLMSHASFQEPHPDVGRPDSTIQLLSGFTADRRWPAALWEPRASLTPVANLPELVLAPAALDFPRREAPARRYAGPCVDLERHEPTFPWHRLRGEPLVYMVFEAPTPHAPFVGRIGLALDIARHCPELDVVIATGGAAIRGPIPDNAICVAQAPQLGLLGRAALMVSHGSLGPLKEALLYGVPSIMLPLVEDQPGNAARLAFHGLGAAVRWHDVTGEQLAALIRGVLGSTIPQRTAAFGKRLRVEQARPSAAAALGELLAACASDPLR